jgi:hypothetical protein
MRIGLMLAFLPLALAAPAAAEPAAPGPIAQAVNAGFLQFVPAPPSPVAVCVVDSGVTQTPDTAGSLIDSQSLVGGAAVGDVDDVVGGYPHGTTVASVIAAPANGWGTVGVWPSAQIVSVRIFAQAGAPATASWAAGIVACLHAPAPVRVINLSLDAGQGVASRALEQDAVAIARSHGVSVVVAAGNTPGPPTDPADLAGVVAVAGEDSQGALCPSSASAAGIIVALGCGVPTSLTSGVPVESDGTSLAAAAASAVLAGLRAYRPDLTAAQAEALLATTAAPGPGGTRRIDAAAAFAAAGLASLVAMAPHAPAEGPPVPPSVVRPRILSVRVRRGLLSVRIAALPVADIVELSAGGRHARSRRTLVRLHLRGQPANATLIVIDPRTQKRSAPRTIHLGRRR